MKIVKNNSGNIAIDVTITFDDPHVGAQKLIERCLEEMEMQMQIQSQQRLQNDLNK